MDKVNGFGIASLALGILGILLTCVFGISGLFGIVGLVMGILGLTIMKDSKKGLAIAGLIVSSIALVIGIAWLSITSISRMSKKDYANEQNNVSYYEEEISSNNELSSQEEVESVSEEPVDEGHYKDNIYYEVIEESRFQDKLGYVVVVDKVKGKKDISATSTLLVYDKSGNVIGKSTDDIVLTEGENNYFKYTFKTDQKEMKFDMTASAKDDTILVGERKAVKMENYNLADNHLYITVKQVGDNVSMYSKFKILFYKDNKIVDTNEGYYYVSAKNLAGKGTTDVIKIPVYGMDFDSIEFIYEP